MSKRILVLVVTLLIGISITIGLASLSEKVCAQDESKKVIQESEYEPIESINLNYTHFYKHKVCVYPRKWCLSNNCNYSNNKCRWANYKGKAIIYGYMKNDSFQLPKGTDKLKMTIKICCRGWGEGLAVDTRLWKNTSGIKIIVDDEMWYNKINESTIKSQHHYSYYKHDYCERFSTGLFNVRGKDNVTLKIEMVDEARLDFWEATLTFYIRPIFDTGSPASPYPSIFGMHNGTIKPNQTINVSKLYTYPCPGTGGHTEYAKIWNATWNATAIWNGYAGDWHNITFDKPVLLLAKETYNYTIRTGSYPQIHHTDNLSTPTGFITCSEFIDANGKRYDDWIPAIRLE